MSRLSASFAKLLALLNSSMVTAENDNGSMNAAQPMEVNGILITDNAPAGWIMTIKANNNIKALAKYVLTLRYPPHT